MAELQLDARPGLALGSYPEQSQTKSAGNVEQYLKKLLNRFPKQQSLSSSELDSIVEEIEQSGKSLQQMPDDVLSMSITGLRLRLARSDATQELAIQAFAMVREVADRVLGLRHFPSQIKGGWTLYNGMLAEMQTGEGKTLTATLPACAAAMSGVPVHVITSNDYLAQRDADTMRPVYEKLGLSVDSVVDGMEADERIAAYACDVTYCTNKQIAFDYLRDRVELGSSSTATHLKLQRLYEDEASAPNLLLRGLCYAIVDEADSVLIDEARTPLILSRPVDGGEDQQTYEDALELAAQLSLDADFTVNHRERSARLTERGSDKLQQLVETMSPSWRSTRRREELVTQALTAECVFVRDRDYLVKDDKVQIIDNYTGRLMPDRSWERGLHQMIEMKEGCEVSGDKETLAKISYQRFFRRYLKLSGMTGTTKNVEGEFAEVYGLPVVKIPTHRLNKRIRIRPRTFYSIEKKNQAVIKSIRKFIKHGRPVLVGTRSVQMSERLGILLAEAGIEARILNARQDAEEAEIIRQAGQPGVVTVATNMAGRGTDIDLSAAAKQRGGLHVIVTERNEASRIDRQLIGRCSRQGDPGSYQVLAALEDEIPSLYFSRVTHRLLRLFAVKGGEYPKRFGNWLLDLSQQAMERRHRQARAELEKQDETMSDRLAFSGKGE